MKKYIILIILIIVFTMSNIFAGEITALNGRVEVQKDGKWQPASIGTEIMGSDLIRTGSESSAMIKLKDDTLLKINAMSVLSFEKLVIKENKRNVLIQLLAGKLRALVNKVVESKEYQFTTPTAVCGVRGTDFGIISQADNTEVYVFEGSVEVKNKQGIGEPVIIPSMKKTVIYQDKAPSVFVDVTPEEAKKDWDYDYKLALNEETNEEPIEENKEIKQEQETTKETQEKAKTQKKEKKDRTKNKSKKKKGKFIAKGPWIPKSNIPSGSTFKFNASFGPITVGDETYQQIIFMPDFSISGFGIGFYTPFIYKWPNFSFNPITGQFERPYLNDLNNNGQQDDGETINWKQAVKDYWYNWDDYNFGGYLDGRYKLMSAGQAFGNVMRDILRDFLLLFRYVRWGFKGSKPVFVMLGSIDNMCLGHRVIVDNYSNMLEFPAERNTGIQFDLDLGIFGFETMVADFWSLIGSEASQSIDNAVNLTNVASPWKNKILGTHTGGRLYVRPLWRLTFPFIRKMAIGFTGIVDFGANYSESAIDNMMENYYGYVADGITPEDEYESLGGVISSFNTNLASGDFDNDNYPDLGSDGRYGTSDDDPDFTAINSEIKTDLMRRRFVQFYGVDIEQPLFQKPNFNLITYIDLTTQGIGKAKYENSKGVNTLGWFNSMGFVTGLRGKLFIFEFLGEYRYLRGGFQTSYFNYFYDQQKSKKMLDLDVLMNNLDTVGLPHNGLVFEISFIKEDMLKLTGRYEVYFPQRTGKMGYDSLISDVSSDFKYMLSPEAQNNVILEAVIEKGLVEKIFKKAPKQVPRIYGGIRYERRNITLTKLQNKHTRWFDENTLITAQLVYPLDNKLEIRFTFKKSFVMNPETGELEHQQVVLVDTTLGFF